MSVVECEREKDIQESNTIRVTTEPTSTSKPRLMTKCIVDLQSSSDVYPMKERVEVSLSCHPFCSSKEGNKQVHKCMAIGIV